MKIDYVSLADRAYYFYTMEHRGGLKEALSTAKRVSPAVWFSLLPEYHFYSFDRRLGDGAIRFIRNVFDTGHPVWLIVSECKDLASLVLDVA